MRPARKGPENLVAASYQQARVAFASMRPARKGPENRRERGGSHGSSMSFNEAGPQGAGKPRCVHHPLALVPVGFNEAGPQGAGKPIIRNERTSNGGTLQ